MSGVALVVAVFFDWYGREVGPAEASLSGWKSLTAIDIVLTVIGALAVIQWIARGSGWLDRRPLPLAPATVMAALGVVAVLLVVVRIVDLPDAAAAAGLDGRRVGTFLALFAAVGIVLGAAATPLVRDAGSGPGQP